MPDLEERFRSLARTPVPDLWHAAIAREPQPTSAPSRPHRAIAALTALIVAAAGFAVVVVSFRGDDRPGSKPEPSPTLGPRTNGPIWFRVGGGDGPSFMYEVRPDGTGERLVFGSESEPLRVSQIAWSPDGERIAYVDPVEGDRGVYVSDPDGADPVRLTDGANDGWPTWSPDGAKIAFSSTRDDPSGRTCESTGDPDLLCPTDIYVMDADGSNVHRLTTDPAPEYRPVWSPDGSKIAFVKTFDCCATAVYVMDADGADVRQVSSHDGGSDFSASWSPDGSQLVFASIRYEDWGIFVVNADGTGEHPLVSNGPYVNDPVWSPDGKSIAFVGLGFEDSFDSTALYVMRADGSAITRLTSGALDRYGVSGDLAWQPISSPSESVIPEPTHEPVAVESSITTIAGIGPYPNAIIAGEGAVWVSAPRNDGSGGGDLVRIDPVTGDVVARVPVDALPTWEVGGGGIATGQGSVWVIGDLSAGGTCCRAVLSRIDPGMNEVAEMIDLGAGSGADVWIDDSAIWALLRAVNGPGHEVVRIDPIDNHVTARTPIPAGWSQTIFVAGGWVWVLGTAPHESGPVEPNTLYRLDPVSGELLETVPLHEFVWIPVVGTPAIWFRAAEGIQRIDPTTGEPVGDPIPPRAGCCSGPFVSDGAGGAWVGSTRNAGDYPAVWHIDATGTIVAEGAIDPADRDAWLGVAHSFDPVTQTIWIAHYEDSVTRIELRTAAG